MRVHSTSVLFSVLIACGEHTVDPASIAIPDSGVFTSSTGLIKQVISCPAGTELVAESQTCSSSPPSSHPSAISQVTVHYTGWTMDGTEFDSSVRRGKPISFGLNQVIRGWTEGVQTMVENEQARLWIPEDLAYQGKQGPPAGMLVFDIELLAFTAPVTPTEEEPAPEAPEAPAAAEGSSDQEDGAASDAPETPPDGTAGTPSETEADASGEDSTNPAEDQQE